MVVLMPAWMHSCITDQMRSSPARTCSSVCQVISLAMTMSLMLQSGLRGMGKQLVAGAERVPHGRRVGDHDGVVAAGHLGVVEDEAAADRVERPLRQHRPPSSKARNTMALEWNRAFLVRCRTMSSARLNLIGCSPSSGSSPVSVMVAIRSGVRSGSTASGRSPIRPRATAGMLPWPLPVAPRDPNSSTVTRSVEVEQPVLLPARGRTGRRRSSGRRCVNSTVRCRS